MLKPHQRRIIRKSLLARRGAASLKTPGRTIMPGAERIKTIRKK